MNRVLQHALFFVALGQIGWSADFFTVPSYTVTGATTITSGDFNGDGITDLATAGASTVSILIGKKNGTFTSGGSYTITSGPVTIAAGDLNNDSKQDLVVLIGTGSVGLNVLLGKGNGTFQAAHPVYFSGMNRSDLVLADFDGDGNLDVAASSNFSHAVSVLLGKGTGGFQSAVDYSTGAGRGFGPNSLAAGDINNDGKIDLVAGTTSQARIFIGNGDGTFQAVMDGPTVFSFVFLADLNHDGHLDIISSPLFGGNLFIALGNGDGSFQTPVVYTSNVGGATSPETLAILDENGDGNFDVITVEPGTQSVNVLLGNGDGTLHPSVLYSVGSDPIAIIASHFGSAQKPGFAVADGGSSQVDIVVANPDGTLQAPRITIVPSPQSAAVGDLNGDGKNDVVTGNGASLDVSFGNGDGTFQSPVVYTTNGSVEQIAIGDLNGDGKLDVAFASTSNRSGAVLIMLNNGDGTLASPVAYNLGNDAVGIALGDFNGDHSVDLAVTSLTDSNVSVLLNNGDGTFKSALTAATAFNSNAVTGADFNGDGKLDAAVQGSTSITVLIGNGDGTFASSKNYAVGQFVKDVRTADFNNDGKPDLVASDYDAEVLDLLLNKGDGTFGKASAIPLTVTPVNFEVGDFNGDGNQDIAVATDLQILNGNGDGTFQAATQLKGCNGEVVISANLFGGAKPDLLDMCSGQLVVFPNAAGGH